MAKAQLKTVATDASVQQFLEELADPQQREDCLRISDLMSKATKSKPKMWGSSIIGFGDYYCKYASGREFDWFKIGFAPRKKDITLYLSCDLSQRYGDLLKELGKHKASKGCLHIKRLADVDHKVLNKLIKQALADFPKSS